MTIDIWKKCDGKNHIKEMCETAWRMTPLEEKISTRKLVDSLEEQSVLEEMIEESRPHILLSYSTLHPWLREPFRYPPLEKGSRFGKQTEPSLWYGSLTLETAAAEKAYHRLLFFHGSTTSPKIISSQFKTFSAKIRSHKALALNENPFIQYKHLISSPISYEASQLLGFNMRENKIDIFSFHSARDPDNGVNTGLFNPNAFADKNPHSFQIWQCTTTKNLVEFTLTSATKERSLSFPIHHFLVNDVLPFSGG